MKNFLVAIVIIVVPLNGTILSRSTFEEWEGTPQQSGWTISTGNNGDVLPANEDLENEIYQRQSHGRYSLKFDDPDNSSYANAYKTFTNSSSEYMVEFYLWIYHSHETIDSFPLCVLWNIPGEGLPEKTDVSLFLHESGDSFLVYLEDSAGIQQDVATIGSTDRWYKIQIYRYVSGGDTVVTFYLDGDSIDTYVPMNKNKVSNTFSLGTTVENRNANGEIFVDDLIITGFSETEYGSNGVSEKIRTMITQIQNLMAQINNYDVFNHYFTKDDVLYLMNLVNVLNTNFTNLSNYEKLSYFNELIIKLGQIKLGLLYGNLNETEKKILHESLNFAIDKGNNLNYNKIKKQ